MMETSKKKPNLPVKQPPSLRSKLTLFPNFNPSANNLKLVNDNSTLNQHYYATNYVEAVRFSPDKTKLNDKSNVEPDASISTSFFNDTNYLFMDSNVRVEESNFYNHLCESHSKENNKQEYLKNRTNLIEANYKEKREACKSLPEEFLTNDNVMMSPLSTPRSDTSQIDKTPSQKPTLPPKRSKFNTTKRTILSEVISSTHDEQRFSKTLHSFKSCIFLRPENRICADCQIVKNTPKWIASNYLITLCDLCAEIHKKLPHKQNEFYLIEINQLFYELNSNQIEGVDVDLFLNIFEKTGNEKFNSLIESQIEKAQKVSNMKDVNKMDGFIRTKYFQENINLSDFGIDSKNNYINELNQEIIKIVSTPAVSLTIFYLYLGANINYVDPIKKKSPLEFAIEFSQQLQIGYLKLNKAIAVYNLKNNESIQFLDHEFFGCLSQIFDINLMNQVNNECEVKVRLSKENIYLSSLNQLIPIRSIIKSVCLPDKQDIVEIKWCNQSNNSLVSTYFYFMSNYEKKIWMKEIFLKLLINLNRFHFTKDTSNKNDLTNLIEIIDSTQIKSIGYLDLVISNRLSISSSGLNDQNKVLAVLLDSSDIQTNYVRRYLILVKQSVAFMECFYDIIDLKKVILLKKTSDAVILSLPNKNYTLKSNGYLTNLNSWYQHLETLSKLSSSTIDDQYLSNDDIPILIDKCCSFVEANYIKIEKFYPSALFKHEDFEITNKHALKTFEKLLKNRDYILNMKNKPLDILNMFKLYFQTYFTSDHLNLFFKLEAYETNDTTSQIDLLKQILKTHSYKNVSFYNCIKRLIIHLNKISVYSQLNKMNSEYLSELFSFLILSEKKHANKSPTRKRSLGIDKRNQLTKVLKLMISNCSSLFDLYNEYLEFDQNIKSSQSLTVYLPNKSINKSFTIIINEDQIITCNDVLLLARSNFNLEDEISHMTLYEVLEEKMSNYGFECKLLPDSILNNKSSIWNTPSHYIIKQKSSQFNLDNPLSSGMNFNEEECVCMILCELCFSTLKCNSSVHTNWCRSHLTVANGRLLIVIDKVSEDKKGNAYIDSENNFNFLIDDCKYYYGLKHISSQNSESISVSNSMELEEECLGVYDSQSNQFILVQIKDKTDILNRYLSSLNASS